VHSNAGVIIETKLLLGISGGEHNTYEFLYSASHSRVAPEIVGLQKEQKCNTFAFHTFNEVRLCVL
jgi:hypothetical protein